MTGRTVILGLGNPILSDDAVGLRVVEALQRRLAESPLPGVDVLLSTRAGFELLEMLQGYRRAVIVDCLDLPDPQPGRVRRLGLDDFRGSARLNSPHEINLADAFELARQLQIEMPAEVTVVAVEAQETLRFGEELTEPVAAVVEPLANELYEELKQSAAAGSDDEDHQPRQAWYTP